MRPSSTRNMPTTPLDDILPALVSSFSESETIQNNKTSSNILWRIHEMKRGHTIKPFEITPDRYKRNLHVIFASDAIINICRSIHERPLGACINLFLAEDVKETACVCRAMKFLAPRVPQPKRLGTRSPAPYEHTMERVFNSYTFDSEIFIPTSIYDRLVKETRKLQNHQNANMSSEEKNTYQERMKQELTTDVNMRLINAREQMKMGVINVHINYMAANSASVDMLSAIDDIGRAGEECCLSTALDIVVSKQLDQWLVPEKDQMDAVETAINIFDAHTATPTEDAGLTITVHGEEGNLPVGGILMISGMGLLKIPTFQRKATYERKVRSMELKNEHYDTDRLMVQPNIARQAFPNYTMDSRLIVKEHNRDDSYPEEEEKEVAANMSKQNTVTILSTQALTDGAMLLDNVSKVYIVDSDKEQDPLVSRLTHTTQSMWNMMNMHAPKVHMNGDFMKSDKMSHVYMYTGTPDIYLNPSGKKIQNISWCMIKDAVFNDPYIYSPYFAQCFNTMYAAAMKLPPTRPTRLLFLKCMTTARKVFKDAHAWHAKYRRNRRDFTSTENGDMIMNELHPYFDALPHGDGLKAYSRLVHGNMPLYIRPTASMLLAGRRVAESIWGHTQYKECKADIKTANVLAREIHNFFCEIVPTIDRGATHMLYSMQEQSQLAAPPSSTPDVSSMYAAEPTSLIKGLCGLPFIYHTAFTKRGDQFKWKDPASDLIVKLDVPQLDNGKYTERGPIGTCFFHSLEEKDGGTTFSYMVRPAFHELMKEIRASTDCFAVKMCAMFCAWIRLTAEGTEFAFNHTHWPLGATVLSFKEDNTRHIMISRPNNIISLADIPTTDIELRDDMITISPTAHHRIACDGFNSNSVIALHALGSAQNDTFCMGVSTPPTKMKDIKTADITTHAFTGYKKLVDSYHAMNKRKRTHTGQTVISKSGVQLAWVCPPVVPESAFQRPTNPTGRSSLPHTSDTPLVDASVEVHDPTRDNGTGISTLNPYATLPGGYVFCLHADPNGMVGEVNNCTYMTNHGASSAAHFFSPPQIMMANRASSSLAKRLCRLPCSRRVMGDHKKFPISLDADSCNSMMSHWSETTGLAQHEPHASNALIYANMISNRKADSTYAAREVEWSNHHYAVLGHTFYAKNKSYANKVVSPI